jgi:hypothetical protein
MGLSKINSGPEVYPIAFMTTPFLFSESEYTSENDGRQSTVFAKKGSQ